MFSSPPYIASRLVFGKSGRQKNLHRSRASNTWLAEARESHETGQAETRDRKAVARPFAPC